MHTTCNQITQHCLQPNTHYTLHYTLTKVFERTSTDFSKLFCISIFRQNRFTVDFTFNFNSVQFEVLYIFSQPSPLNKVNLFLFKKNVIQTFVYSYLY